MGELDDADAERDHGDRRAEPRLDVRRCIRAYIYAINIMTSVIICTGLIIYCACAYSTDRNIGIIIDTIVWSRASNADCRFRLRYINVRHTIVFKPYTYIYIYI